MPDPSIETIVSTVSKMEGVSRVHQMTEKGWKALTIFDGDEALLTFALAMYVDCQLKLDQARADCTSSGQATEDYRTRYNSERMRAESAENALDWYGEQARAIHRYLTDKKTDAVMACVTALSLDNGSRAQKKPPEGGESSDRSAAR